MPSTAASKSKTPSARSRAASAREHRRRLQRGVDAHEQAQAQAAAGVNQVTLGPDVLARMERLERSQADVLLRMPALERKLRLDRDQDRAPDDGPEPEGRPMSAVRYDDGEMTSNESPAEEVLTLMQSRIERVFSHITMLEKRLFAVTAQRDDMADEEGRRPPEIARASSPLVEHLGGFAAQLAVAGDRIARLLDRLEL